MKVPFVHLGAQFHTLEKQLVQAFVQVGCSGEYIQGDTVKEFELALAHLCQCSQVVSVANGTDALILALKVLNIGVGDEVITAPNSFIASAGAIAAVGASIRFADVGQDYNLDIQQVHHAITEHTKAIIAVHLTGNPVDMDALTKLTRDRGIYIIEDASQAIDAAYKGRQVGSLGDLACFSLHPLKNLGLLGDAGFIATNNVELAQRLRCLRNHGLISRDEAIEWGVNSRLDAIQAAFGCIKIKYLKQWTARFQNIAGYFHNNLNDFVLCPLSRADDKPVYHNFVVQVHQREALRHQLLDAGVETKVHYPIPLHLMPAARDLPYALGSFPVTEQQSKHIMSLPIYPELSDSKVEYIVEQVLKKIKKLKVPRIQ